MKIEKLNKIILLNIRDTGYETLEEFPIDECLKEINCNEHEITSLILVLDDKRFKVVKNRWAFIIKRDNIYDKILLPSVLEFYYNFGNDLLDLYNNK